MPHTTRLLLTAFPFALALCAVTPAPALAAEYPFCMSRVAGRIGLVEECNYVSMEQCWANSTGVNGSCAPNWRLQYYRQHQIIGEPPVRRRYRKHRAPHD